MQFLVYDPNQNPDAAAAPPSPELMAEMDKFRLNSTSSATLVY